MKEIKLTKQVDKTHYSFANYLNKKRWSSIWYQINEILITNPRSVLEIGPGPGILKSVCAKLNTNVETLDIDPELNPDHLASVFEMPFEDGSYDSVCAFQVLEHMHFKDSLMAFNEMVRVSNNRIIISLPDSKVRYPLSVMLPKVGEINFLISKPNFKKNKHVFDGQHYWELNKIGYRTKTVLNMLLENKNIKLLNKYSVPDNPYHCFFIFEKI